MANVAILVFNLKAYGEVQIGRVRDLSDGLMIYLYREVKDVLTRFACTF